LVRGWAQGLSLVLVLLLLSVRGWAQELSLVPLLLSVRG
jgi:hypothetical protein